ncbi:MAG: hypothetical protein WD775_04900 [Burkholderiales bacterium]
MSATEAHMKRTAIWAVVAALLALGAAGCGEREQTTQYRDGKYRGKSDMRPWDNAPAATSPGTWSKGDRETWENEMRSRTVTSQNEHRRIGH